MIVEAVTIAAIAMIGIPIALLLDHTARGGLLWALGIEFGLGLTAAVLFTESMTGIAWSRAALVLPLVIIAAVAAFIALRAAISAPRNADGGPRSLTALFGAATVVGLAGYATFATLTTSWEFDYLHDWGMKARNFWIFGRIDWTFLEQVYGRAVHSDYPLLLPLSFDALALVHGVWNDRAFGLLNVAFAIATLLAVHRIALDEGLTRVEASFMTLTILPFAATPWIGIAETPLVAYSTTAVLLLRRASPSITAAAVLLGCLANVKNEGVTFVIAVAVALAAAGRAREIVRLWPAALIALPWLILRSAHHLRTDLTTGNFLSRIGAHLLQPGLLIDALRRYPVGKPFFWLGVVVALFLLGRQFIARERFVLITVITQFTFYIGAYLSSPFSLDWHLRWSWDRLVAHLTPLLAIVLLLNLMPRLRREYAS